MWPILGQRDFLENCAAQNLAADQILLLERYAQAILRFHHNIGTN